MSGLEKNAGGFISVDRNGNIEMPFNSGGMARGYVREDGIAYVYIFNNIIFDVKMDFTWKARWVLDGHKTETPDISTYAGVVSKESVRIALTYAALNGIDVMAADIQNAYLQAPSSQKH